MSKSRPLHEDRQAAIDKINVKKKERMKLKKRKAIAKKAAKLG
jgi:hypothetical protein